MWVPDLLHAWALLEQMLGDARLGFFFLASIAKIWMLLDQVVALTELDSLFIGPCGY